MDKKVVLGIQQGVIFYHILQQIQSLITQFTHIIPSYITENFYAGAQKYMHTRGDTASEDGK